MQVGLAMSTYDLVDKHIQRLDRSLKKFEEEVKHRSEKEGATPKEAFAAAAVRQLLLFVVGFGKIANPAQNRMHNCKNCIAN